MVSSLRVRAWFSGCFFGICVIAFQGHAGLSADLDSAFPPRSQNTGIKSGPCGPDPETPQQSRPIYQTGTFVSIKWLETIQHPGRYEFRISTDGGRSFPAQPLLVINDAQDGRNDLPHRYQAQLRMPDSPCAHCVLQLIQVMTDRNPPSNYYSCSDFGLTDDPAQTRPPPRAAGATPSPLPTTPGPAPGPEIRPPQLPLKLEWIRPAGGDR